FFVQAEDGIRDRTVTGVQTCALPIFKGLPSRIGHLLDIPLRELEKVLYFESYIVIDPGDLKEIKERELLTDERYREMTRDFPGRSEEHTSELQSPYDIVCRLLLEKKK